MRFNISYIRRTWRRKNRCWCYTIPSGRPRKRVRKGRRWLWGYESGGRREASCGRRSHNLASLFQPFLRHPPTPTSYAVVEAMRLSSVLILHHRRRSAREVVGFPVHGGCPEEHVVHEVREIPHRLGYCPASSAQHPVSLHWIQKLFEQSPK